MDRYGHLMEGLDYRTADRLDALAAFSGGPGLAQTDPTEELESNENPCQGDELAVPTRFELAFPA